MSDLAALQQTIGYQFKDKALLERALTHRSASKSSYERLEFLGDAVLSFIIAEILYLRCPNKPEGQLSRMRAALVNRDTLSEIARGFDLGQYLFLGSGEVKAGGRERVSILSDVVEGLIGAIYLDDGIDTVKHCVTAWFEEMIDKVMSVKSNKDAKSQLQEWAQAHKKPLPIYTVTDTKGKAHDQQFYVSCQIEGLALITKADAPNRRKAEQQAAEQYLEQIAAGE